MNTYSVHIVEPEALGIIGGPFAVWVVRHHPREGDKHVAATSGCRSLERAESVARDYRAQFGVSEGQS